MWLKQSTVAVINFGPMLDKTDGVTLETGAGIITSLDHATTGIMLSKNGGTLTIREQGGNFVATTYDAHGFYKVSLSAVDTGTLGRLKVVHTEPATYLAVWHDFMVVPANVWDSLFGADKLDVAVVEQANIDFGATQKASITAAVPTAAAIGTDAAGKVLVTPAQKLVTDASGYVTYANAAPPAASAIADAVLDEAVAGHTGLIAVSLPNAAPGANGGLPTTNGTKINQTVDLTSGQSIACSDKTGFSLSSTGADLILKSSTFAQAIVAAINEFATYGLTALNTLLVTTGIKTATTAAPTDMALNSTVAKDATVSKPGTAQTITAPADMALNSTVAKEATLGTVAGYIDTEIGTIITAVGTTIPNAIAALPTDADVNAACDTAISDAAIPAATAALVLVTPAQKIVTDINGKVTYSNTAPPSAADVKTEMEAAGGKLALSKTILDKVDNMIEVVP